MFIKHIDHFSEHEVLLSEYRIIFSYLQVLDVAKIFKMEEFEKLEKPEKYHFF